METIRADSKTVAAVLKKELEPDLRQLGFTQFKGRRAYRYHDECVLGCSTNAVGSRFSSVTGFPAASFGAMAWVHYNFVPSFERPIANSRRHFCPKSCHFAEVLCVASPSLKEVRKCRSDAEQERDDIWWVEPDGSNLYEVVDDVRTAIMEQAVRWWDSILVLENALKLASEQDVSPNRSFLMYFLGNKLGLADVVEKYEPQVKNKTEPGMMISV